ncbi:hypothetical protein MC65_015615 [Aeromonas caviae]|nr:hypothetical protein MC65_015615 [Aeromonas caviae]
MARFILAIWLSGYLAIWLSGYLAIWLSGYLAIWLSGLIVFIASSNAPHEGFLCRLVITL